MLTYSKVFAKDYIEQVKKEVEERNKLHNFNNLPYDKGTRWVGRLGEETLREMLILGGLSEGTDFEYVSKENEKAPFDFRIRELNLDVKMLATNYYPKLDYACDIDIDQYKKPECNAYLFGRFLVPEDRAILIGWITKQRFTELKTDRKSGVCLNAFTPGKDFYEISIEKLNPLVGPALINI